MIAKKMLIPSKKQLDEQKKDFSLILQDDYILEIESLKETQQENYNKTGMEDIVNITFNILSLKDGNVVKDINGDVVKNRKIFFTARPNNVGFMKDGTPSKTRSLISYITHQDIFEEMIFDNWNDLVGELVNAEIIQYINGKGEKKNKIGRFLPTKIKNKDIDENIPVVEDEVKKE